MAVYLSTQTFDGNPLGFLGGVLLVVVILAVALYRDLHRGQK